MGNIFTDKQIRNLPLSLVPPFRVTPCSSYQVGSLSLAIVCVVCDGEGDALSEVEEGEDDGEANVRKRVGKMTRRKSRVMWKVKLRVMPDEMEKEFE